MRIPDAGPLGETFREANWRAIVSGDLLNNPVGGWVESVVTLLTHLEPFVEEAIGCLLCTALNAS